MDIVTIGEVLIDLTQTGKDERGIPQFAANPGGAPANLAVAAARLGAQTAFIGKVGADAFGRYLKEVLAENKVDVSGMAVDADHPTTMAVVSVDATGERDFSFYRSANADVMLSKEDISEGALKFTGKVHDRVIFVGNQTDLIVHDKGGLDSGIGNRKHQKSHIDLAV